MDRIEGIEGNLSEITMFQSSHDFAVMDRAVAKGKVFGFDVWVSIEPRLCSHGQSRQI